MIEEIKKDLFKNYPYFAREDSKTQIILYNENIILLFHKDREFLYNMESGMLYFLYKGTIESMCNKI